MKHIFCFTAGVLMLSCVHAQQATATLYNTDGSNKPLGTVTFENGQYGLMIKTDLKELPQGIHGLHLHQNASCADSGMAAGGHYDPNQSNSHQGPYGHGHLGDLPVLAVDSAGMANTVLLAPRLKVNDLKGLTLMVHAGGDNYSNTPPLGGGGARIACGIIKMSKTVE